MAHLVRRFRGAVRQLLLETASDLESLVSRSDKYKAKDPALAIFTDAEKVKVEDALALLSDKAEEEVPR